MCVCVLHQSLQAANVSAARKREITSDLTSTLVDVLVNVEDVASVNVLAVVEGLASTTADSAAVSTAAADQVLSGLGSATSILEQQAAAGGTVDGAQLGSVLGVYSKTLSTRFKVSRAHRPSPNCLVPRRALSRLVAPCSALSHLVGLRATRPQRLARSAAKQSGGSRDGPAH
eukprot:1077115-Prorocentrum_minimum.AAC.3